jgi:hypothetical protein
VDRSPDEIVPATEVVVFGALVGDAEVELACWALDLPSEGAGLGVVDHLARLHLAARRMGADVRLRHAGVELAQLLVAVGLGDLLSPR